MKTKILIADEEIFTVEILSSELKKNGYLPIGARDGEQAFRIFRTRSLDLIILSLSLPKIDGMNLCRRIRWESDVPIIILTTEREEKGGKGVNGLNLGADDYLTKPFTVPELVARVNAVLRRGADRESPGEVTYGPITLNFDRHEVFLDGSRITLTPTEFKILKTLVQHPGRVFSREQLLKSIRGKDARKSPTHTKSRSKRVIDVHINKLRKKTKSTAGYPEFIHTVYGIGYKFELRSRPEVMDSSP